MTGKIYVLFPGIGIALAVVLLLVFLGGDGLSPEEQTIHQLYYISMALSRSSDLPPSDNDSGDYCGAQKLAENHSPHHLTSPQYPPVR